MEIAYHLTVEATSILIAPRPDGPASATQYEEPTPIVKPVDLLEEQATSPSFSACAVYVCSFAAF